MSISGTVTQYGMKESRQRLSDGKFHPEVTTKTAAQLENDTIRYLKSRVFRPDRSKYVKSRKQTFITSGRIFYRLRRLTKVSNCTTLNSWDRKLMTV